MSYIPELRQVHSRFGAIDQITIRMLLSHSAGFQSPTWPSGREVVVANGRDFDPGMTIPNSGWNAPLGDLAAYGGAYR